MSIGTHSYNQSIRFYNAVFMEVFNDIYLKRLNKNIKVPIEWTDKRKEEVLKDEEGMQTMRTLGNNMAWLLKSIEAGKKAGIKLPENESIISTNFIR